jgi:hypothetical protein
LTMFTTLAGMALARDFKFGRVTSVAC